MPSIAGPVFERHGRAALHIALLYAFCDGSVVTLSHLLAGIEIAERWRPQSYGILASIGPSRDEKVVQHVVEMIRRRPGVLRRNIMSGLRLSAKEMKGAHETLSQRGWVSIDEQGRGTKYYPTDPPSLERLTGPPFSESGPPV